MVPEVTFCEPLCTRPVARPFAVQLLNRKKNWISDCNYYTLTLYLLITSGVLLFLRYCINFAQNFIEVTE